MIQIGTYSIELNTVPKIIAYIFAITFVAWIISRLVRYLIVLYLKTQKPAVYKRTSLQFFKNSIKFCIGLIAFVYIIMSVPVFRSQASVIFSGAGILAAIIGFAAQAALSNLIAGAFIVIFKPFRVGDYIKLDDLRTGIVDDITLRHTVINNFENKRLIIPNSIISTESILNHTIQDSHILSFNDFKLGLKADIDLARTIIFEEVEKLPQAIPRFKPKDGITATTYTTEVRVVDINESFLELRAYVWLTDPFKEFQMKCLLREKVHKRFIKEGVDLPIPIRKVIAVS